MDVGSRRNLALTLRRSVLEWVTSTCLDDHDRLRIPPVPPPQSSGTEKKESGAHRHSQPSRRLGKPSSTSLPSLHPSDARTVRNSSPTPSDLNCQSSANYLAMSSRTRGTVTNAIMTPASGFSPTSIAATRTRLTVSASNSMDFRMLPLAVSPSCAQGEYLRLSFRIGLLPSYRHRPIWRHACDVKQEHRHAKLPHCRGNVLKSTVKTFENF